MDALTTEQTHDGTWTLLRGSEVIAGGLTLDAVKRRVSRGGQMGQTVKLKVRPVDMPHHYETIKKGVSAL